jgi:hypothetical protein
MRKSRMILAGAALAVGLGAMASAPAADANQNFSSAQIAGATIEQGGRTGYIWVLDGKRVGTGSGGLVQEEFGCVYLESAGGWVVDVASSDVSSGGDFEGGCGPLNVDIDPVLQKGTAKGTIETWRYNPETNESEPSTISVDVAWEGKGNLRPVVGHGEYLGMDPDQQSGYGSVWFDLGAGRSAAAAGRLISAEGASVEGPSTFADIFEGVNVFVTTYA